VGRRDAAGGRPFLAAALIAAALAVGLGTPWFVDFDEAVYAEVARGMSVSGDWVRPAWNGAPFYEKPALFYWLTAALYAVIGVTPVAPRAVSLLATVGGLFFLAVEVRRRLDARAAEAAVWLAGATLLPFTLGRLGLLDALLTASMTVALLAFSRGLEAGEARRWLALGYLATGVALAVKGPAFPLLLGAILLAEALLGRRLAATLRSSGMAWGVPLLLAIGLPWYVLAWRADGSAFLDELIGAHTLSRLAAPMQGHAGPIWYYLPVLAVGLMPFSALLPGALAALRRSGGAARRAALLAAAWAVVPLLAFSAAATKLPQYVAPAVPALALLVAAALAGRAPVWRPRSWHAVLAAALAAAAAIALVPSLLARTAAAPDGRALRVLPGLVCLPSGGWRYVFLPAAGLLAGGALLAWRRGVRGAELAALRLLGIGAAASWAALWIAAGQVAERVAIAPLVTLARQADAELPAGAPLHLVQLNHRVTPALATGRRLVFLSARRGDDRERLRALLAGRESVRVIVPEGWWRELHAEVGGRELARTCGHVLVGEAPGRATAAARRDGT
jgi:4-amino-4-deoxy-L-arabinose transferase-like glycosyltransferase